MLLLICVVVFVAAIVLYYRQAYLRFKSRGVKNLVPVPILGDMARITFRMEHMFENVDRVYKSFPGESYFYPAVVTGFSLFLNKFEKRPINDDWDWSDEENTIVTDNYFIWFIGSFEFTRPVIFIRDIELVKKITVKDFEHFVDRAVTIDEKIDPLFGKNLFSSKGQKWKDMRSTLSPAFTSSKMRVMIPFMAEAGDQMINRIRKNIQESETDYYDIDIKDLSNRYASDVIASCAFGLKVDSQNQVDQEFYKMGKMASQFTFLQVLKFLGYQSYPTIMKVLKVSLFTKKTEDFFRQLVTQTMKERETQKIYRPDMIHLLMEAKKGNLLHEEDKESEADAGFATVEESTVGKKTINRDWSDDDLTAQALIFFIAGFETVATTMAFLVLELALNPDIQDKLVLEIKEHEKGTGGKLDTAIQQLTYLDMVVSELLRLWSPGGLIERVCTKDYNLGTPNDKATKDYIIRKGEGVNIPVWAFHRDPQYFPEPTKFDPERFSKENRHKILPFTYNPFGIGPRNCIGSRFALLEVKVMIYQLLQHVEVSPCERTRVPIKLCTNTFDLVIKGGHWIRLKARK